MVRWLELLHPNLPNVLANEYFSELDSKSLVDLQPILAKNLDCLMDKASALEQGSINRTRKLDYRTNVRSRRRVVRCELCSGGK